MNYLTACRNFIRELFRDFHHTGAVLPSSRFLARAMVKLLLGPRKPARILEVGPGTGAITTEIVRRLGAGDQLDIVEINPHFTALLRHRLASEPALRKKADQIDLFNSPVQELVGRGTYDFVISGLPMNNFPASLVRELFRVFRRLLRPGGTFSFFEYILVRELKKPFVNRGERRRLSQVGRIVGKYVREHQIDSQPVLANIPPAWVRHLRF